MDGKLDLLYLAPERLRADSTLRRDGYRKGAGHAPIRDPPDRGTESCYYGNTKGSIDGMKVSISLPEDDVEFLDSYARVQGIESRSAVLQKAVGLLRATQLADAYEEAWGSWASSDDADAWEIVIADGLGN